MTNRKHTGTFKKLGLAVLLLTLVFTVTACGGGGSSVNYQLDEAGLTSKLLNEATFDCDLYQVQPDRVADFIEATGAENQIMFMGSGAYADSFGIFTLADEAGAKATVETVNAYLADLQASFQDYVPEEADEIANAVVVQKGRYVVFCVSPETEAVRTLIEGSFTEGDAQPTGVTNTENTESADDVSTFPVIESKKKIRDYGVVVSIGDTAYELYSYDDKAAEKYAKAVNRTAEALEGKAQVYEIPIPLSSGITLPDGYEDKISSSNQRKALDNIIKKADPRVRTVNMYENLMRHRDEYIYFRTDHHWTARGAYYGYEAFCEAKGVFPITLDRRDKAEFEGFLGSFYNDTKNKILKKYPDTIEAFYPISENVELTYKTLEGKNVKWDVIHDVTTYPDYLKYVAFIAGDNPYTYIKNSDLQDGSTCVVVKESFGNAFVPFLVDHYEKIYVLDYRYWEGDIVEFAKRKKADDVLFVNNLSMIRSSYLTGKLLQMIG